MNRFQKTLALGYIVAGSFLTNTLVHSKDAEWAINSLQDTVYVDLREVNEMEFLDYVHQVLDYGQTSYEALINDKGDFIDPWLLVPGSFLWRRPERPETPEGIYFEKPFLERELETDIQTV